MHMTAPHGWLAATSRAGRGACGTTPGRAACNRVATLFAVWRAGRAVVTSPSRTSWIMVTVLVVVLVAGCSTPEPGQERHPLPRLPELGSVVLPGGYLAYDEPTA